MLHRSDGPRPEARPTRGAGGENLPAGNGIHNAHPAISVLTPLSGMPLFQQSHSECAREVANDDRNYVQHAHLKLFPPATRLFARASGQKSMAACKRRHVHAPTCKETSARDGPRPETTVSPYFLADGREDPRAAPPEWLARAGTTSHRHWGNAWSL